MVRDHKYSSCDSVGQGEIRVRLRVWGSWKVSGRVMPCPRSVLSGQVQGYLLPSTLFSLLRAGQELRRRRKRRQARKCLSVETWDGTAVGRIWDRHKGFPNCEDSELVKQFFSQRNEMTQ